MLAGQNFCTEIWQRVSPSDREPPDPKDLARSTREASRRGRRKVWSSVWFARRSPGASAKGFQAVTHETPGSRHRGVRAQLAHPQCPGAFGGVFPPGLRQRTALSAAAHLPDSVLGAPAAVVGAVEGAAEGAASLTKLAAGPLGDRFARRPLIATGYGMAALGKVMVAAATAGPGCWRAGWSTGSARDFAAPADALLVVDIDDAARGRVFGFHRAMDTFGAVVGPLLGLAGYELLDHQIAPLLWVAVVPAVLECRAGVPGPGARRVAPRPHTASVFSPFATPRRYWRVTALWWCSAW